MDDELEDKVFYQTYISHMKLLSKFAMGVSPLNSTLAYIWKLLRLYFIRPEVVLFTALCIIFLVYINALESWSHSVLSRLTGSFRHNRGRPGLGASIYSAAERQCWEDVREVSAVFAIQGRRPRMEDR